MQIVKLNLIPGGVLPVCFASQNDTGRVIRFMLFEGENVFTLSGAESIELRLKKPDGSELVESVTNTGADYVDVVTTADTCDTAGASVGEIAITDGGDVLGSANFGLFVESDAFDGGGITTQTATGAIATFETNIETAFASLTADINPVQSGTGTPSPDNVRPISGFSALNVTRTGVNLWDEQWELGTLSADGQPSSSNINIRSKNFIKVMPSATLFIKSPYTAGIGVYQYDSNHNYLTRGFIANNTITLNSNTHYLKFRTPDNVTTYNNDISINYPSSDTEYHAYNGQTATVNFGQTVYGGVADVTNGKVTVTYGIVDLGTLTWSAAGNMWFASLSGVKPIYDTTVPDAICSQYKTVSWVSGTTGTEEGIFCFLPAYNQLRIRDTSYSSASDFQTAMSGVQLVYELATPTEIPTTPENLTALSGQNNVYSDTNGDTTVEYYIEV